MKSIKHFFELLPPILPVPSGVSSHIPDRSDMNIKCVIFDIYGTMLISESGDIGTSHLSGNAALTALNESGVELADGPPSAVAEKILRLYRQFIVEATVEMRAKGISYPEVEIREIWKKIIAELLRDKEIEPIPDAVDFFRLASIFEALNNPVWPMPSMLEVLRNLNGRNIPVGIISNAQFYTPM
ncbi:MAG: HAD family hydrolase, partial [Victivallaceae bacterium]